MSESKDDAVAAVVAVMLILAVISLCIMAYTTTYVPGLKQQDEIDKSNDIRYAFERISSNTDNLISLKKNASFSETFPLGGGDVLLSSVKSSGTVELEQYVIGTLRIQGYSDVDIFATSVEYLPSYSSWEPQGYLYRNGTVWITKDKKNTLASATDFEKYGKMAPSVGCSYKDGTDKENETVGYQKPWLTPACFISPNGDQTLIVTSMTENPSRSHTTGSGYATVRVEAKTEEIARFTNIASPVAIDVVNRLDSREERITYNSGNLTIKMLNIEVSVQ